MSCLSRLSISLRTATIALLLASLGGSVGCGWGKGDRWKFASWDVRKAVGLKKDEKPDPEVPSRLVATWTEATLNRAGEKSKRGFGGRIAFLKDGSEKPVRVDGQLVVYAFDDSGDDPYHTEPKRRYIFPADQLSIYEIEAPIGTTYNVYVPWDEIGGPEQKISLIARFESKEGPIIVGEQTKHYLAGPVSPIGPNGPQLAATPTPGGVTAASFESPVNQLAAAGQHSVLSPSGTSGAASLGATPRGGDALTTTSIPLPRKLGAKPATPQVVGLPQYTGLQSGAVVPSTRTAAPAAEATGAASAPTQTTSPGQTTFGHSGWQMPGTMADSGRPGGPLLAPTR
jgi:hypothetical protein